MCFIYIVFRFCVLFDILHLMVALLDLLFFCNVFTATMFDGIIK